MGIPHWLRDRLLKDEPKGGDPPPGVSIMHTLLGSEPERVRSLGEYNSATYPEEIAEVVRTREEVAAELLRIDITDAKTRVASIPQFQQLLRKYPHPLVYETLIHAYVDAGKYDEAKGVAFAARERRAECARSPHAEIRSETESLREWSTDDVDDLRKDRESRK
ncbi:MAG TPA: hypothetical protein VFI91_09090 [Longimicrobiaceae bacterium]|nr:hypothetical protein [Longimicrobiaceae bacterium]